MRVAPRNKTVALEKDIHAILAHKEGNIHLNDDSEMFYMLE
jgi:hypothetical protein